MFDRLGLRHPIVQAPMAGISTPELAAAVCEAGGLGSVALGALSTEQAAQAISRTRELTERPFAVNLFCHRPARRDARREANWLTKLRPEFERFGSEPPEELNEIYQSFRANPAMLDTLVAVRPAVISFHFGLPLPEQLEALRQTGAMMFATATNPAEARMIADAGLDGIVAQSWQAGGHRGIFDPQDKDERLETIPLLARLHDIGLPVIAAGGIMTREDAVTALDAGAVAVQCGTAFLLAQEASTSPAHRSALNGRETAMTRAISGRPARSMQNLFTAINGAEAPDYPIAYDAGKALNAAATAADEVGYGAFWAGTGAAAAIARPASETVAAISP